MKVGPVFFDSIHTEKIPQRQHYGESHQAIRYWLFVVILLGALGLLIGKLFFLQIVSGSYYRQLSDSNRIHSTPIHAPRGVIFDRNGKPLVINAPGYRIVEQGQTKFLTQADAVDLLAKGSSNLEIDSLRQYPCKDACAHVVGYVGQITPADLKDPLFSNYMATDV